MDKKLSDQQIPESCDWVWGIWSWCQLRQECIRVLFWAPCYFSFIFDLSLMVPNWYFMPIICYFIGKLTVLRIILFCKMMSTQSLTVKCNYLTFNPSKCKYMVISHRRQVYCHPPDLLLDNLCLETTNRFREGLQGVGTTVTIYHWTLPVRCSVLWLSKTPRFVFNWKSWSYPRTEAFMWK